MAKKIVFFNHKGGVSKTTSTFHIGWKLAEQGNRVLLVDADPQCNLTSLFLKDKFYSYYEDETLGKNNIMDGVSSAFKATTFPIEAITCPKHQENDKLFLLPGHMNLSEYDPQLTFAINAYQTLTSMQNLPGSFNQLMTVTAEKYEIDYILIDMNPSLSTINQILFVSSDAFIIPANPDIFCTMAIKSLSRILPQWINWKRSNIENFESTYPLPDGTPLFIGELIQRFNIRKGLAANSYQPLINGIKEITKNTFAPALKKVSMLFDEDKYQSAGIDDYCLSEIKEFGSIGQLSQNTGFPVFAIPDNLLEASGAVKEQRIGVRTDFNTQYTDIANKITSLLS